MAGGIIDGVHITLSDMESYLQGLGQLGKTPRTAPYTAGHVSLSPSQVAAAMHALGYSPAQINAAMSGNLPGHPSGIAGALQAVAGTTAALGPEAAPASGLAGFFGDLFSAGSDAASAASDLPAGQPADAYAPTATDSTTPESTTSDPTSTSDPNLAPRALTPASSILAGDLNAILQDLKYGAIWVGLVLLGLGLIFEGLSRNGAPTPRPSTLIFSGAAAE